MGRRTGCVWPWGRTWLVIGALLLWSGATSARIEPVKMSGRPLQVLGLGSPKSGLTEHQVQQLLSAGPLEQQRQLASMVQQVRVSLASASGGQTSVPDAVVAGWLNSLLVRKRPATEWTSQVDIWMGVAAQFETLRASMLAQRVGINDGLIQANTALRAGHLAQFFQLLKAEIQRTEQELLVANPSDSPAPQRQLADLLMMRAFMAAMRLDQDAFKDMDHVLKLRHGQEDEGVIIMLLMALDSGHVSNKSDRAHALLNHLYGIAERKLQTGHAEVYWRRIQWLSKALAAAIHLGRNDQTQAITALAEAHRLLEGSDVLKLDEPAVRFMAWQTMFNHAVLDNGIEQERLSKLASQILDSAKGLTQKSPSKAETWLALALSEVHSGAVAMSLNTPALAEQNFLGSLRALDRHARLTGATVESAQIHLQVLVLLSHLKVVKSAWVEVLEILKPVEGLRAALGTDSGKTLMSDPQLFSVHAHRALAYSGLGNREEGLAAFERALTITERHLGEVSTEFNWALEGWRVHVDIAEMLIDTSHSDRMLLHRKRASEIAQAAAARQPSNPDWQERSWDSLHDLGEALNDVGDTVAAKEAGLASLQIAERNARELGASAPWSRNVFLSLWNLGTIDSHAGNLRGALEHSEAAAKLAGERYALDASAEFVLLDRWLIENRLGSIRSSLGDHRSALQSHQVALRMAEQALHLEPDSDDWLENAATSHERIWRIFSDQQDWLSSLHHAQAGAMLSGRRLSTTDVRFDVLRAHWIHQFNVGKMHLKLKEHEKARAALTRSRALVQTHWHRFSGEDLWHESRWFEEQELGRLEETEGNLIPAEASYAKAVAFAQASRRGENEMSQTWLARAFESTTSMVRVQAAQGKGEAQATATRLATLQQELLAKEHENNRRIQEKKAISLVLPYLGLSSAQEQSIPKADFMERIQNAISTTRDEAREKGITKEQSERIMRLQNALFAVRQRPD